MNTALQKSTFTPISVIFILGLLSSVAFMLTQKIVPDSVQLLERGYLFTQNQLLPFGPRSTNTNFIFGPFISIFVGTALLIYEHPISPLVGILVTHVVGFFLIQKISFLSSVPRFLPAFLFFYWLSPWRSSEVFLWNPSFLFPLMVLYLYGIDLCYRGKKFSGTLLVVLTTVITFQTHNSFVFLLILGAWIILRCRIYPHPGALLLGSVLGAIMLIPAAKVIWFHPEILEMNRNSAGLFGNLLTVGEAIKGILYWFRYPSLYFGATTFQLPSILWSEAGVWAKVWLVVKWSMAVLSLILVAWANLRFYKKAKGTFLWELVTGAFVALVAVSALSPVPFNFWHLYLIYPLTIIPIAWCVSRIRLKPIAVISLGVYFVTYAAISALNSYKHDYTNLQSESYERLVTSKSREIKNRYSRFTLRIKE
jgi:hypothetical protein